jgi:hypothetical protein
VATAKIVLRIMGLSWFLMDVFSHPACQSGERSVGFNGGWIKNRRKIVRPRKSPRISYVSRGFFAPLERERRMSLPFGLCRKAALASRAPSSRLAALRHGRYKPPRTALLRFPP